MADKLLQIDLAKALGVTPAVVSRDARRGMPTSSVEAAREWRHQHVRARINHKRPARADGTAAGAVRLPGEGGGASDEPSDYWQSRARREKAEAAQAELKLAEMERSLVRLDRTLVC
jgi:hypothetical protein